MHCSGGDTQSQEVPDPGGVPGPGGGVPSLGVYLVGVGGGVYLPRYSSPRKQNDRQVQKYYLAPNFVCGR